MSKLEFSLGQMAQELVDAGDLVPMAEGFFEDMGGHLVHEDMVPSYFEYYLKNLKPAERGEVIARLRGEGDAA
jgi:hypothetical protein